MWLWIKIFVNKSQWKDLNREKASEVKKIQKTFLCNHNKNNWKEESDFSCFVSQLNSSGLTWERGKTKLCVRNDNLQPSHSQASYHPERKKTRKSTDQSLRLHEMMVFSPFVFLFFTTSAFFSLSVCPPPDRSSNEYITSPFNIVLLSNWIESPTPTSSPVLTMDNMSVGLWQIKPARYMAITFTAKDGIGGVGCYNDRETETERGMETHADGWWDISSRVRYSQTQFNVCTFTHTLISTKCS